MEGLGLRGRRTPWGFAIVAALVLASGCAHRPDGPPGLHPAFSAPPEGYSSEGEDIAFTNALVSLKARHEMSPGPETPAFFRTLSERGYLLIRVDVENLSKVRVIFKPSHAVLKTNRLDYGRPLDYTDLYQIAGSAGGGATGDVMSKIKGKFYDLDVMIMPGKRSSRLLVFSPIEPKSSKASLGIRDLYVGTEPLDIFFPFKVRAGQ
ncbi:MAG: hypothetical protein ACE5EI_04705 [Thermodesulfobacteriota bacterium]